MFEKLAAYAKIIVTGPQRSGTTICGKMMAYDTGHRYVDEHEWGPHDRWAWRRLVLTGRRVVVQCPAMCRHVHDFGMWRDVLVVMMKRDVADIIASQERIGWAAREERRELERYGKTRGPIAKVKYDFWDRFQKARIVNWLEVEYESLAGHPLWVPKELRRDFESKQTEMEQCLALSF